MKHVLIAALALASSSAFACPSLVGHFQCKDFDTGSVQDVTLAQNGINYTMTITADGKTTTSQYVADGVLRTVERPEYISRTEKTFCDGDSLKKEVHGVLKAGNEALDAVVTVRMTRDNNMYDSYVGKQGAKDLNFEETCTRVN